MRLWSGMFESGVRAHLAATRLAVPLMLPRRGGLIVHTTAWDRENYLGNLFYDVAKAAVNRMAFGMAQELQPHHVAVVALAPGFVGTERVLAAFVAAGRAAPNLESPEYSGRAAVAAVPDRSLTGRGGRPRPPFRCRVAFGRRGRPRRPRRCAGSLCRHLVLSTRSGAHVNGARNSPTTPTRAPGLSLTLCRLERLSGCHTLFAAERLSPSSRERVPDEFVGIVKDCNLTIHASGFSMAHTRIRTRGIRIGCPR
jgi:hypothetical protein